MAAPCRIRPATTADAPAIAALERATFSDPWPAGAFAHPGPGTVVLVAERDGAVAGYLVARRAADEGEVLNVAVEPATRREGVGTALWNEALAWFEAGGVRAIHLEVRAGNGEAIAFYRGLGFTIEGRRPGYYRKPPEDAVLMGRSVPPVTGPA